MGLAVGRKQMHLIGEWGRVTNYVCHIFPGCQLNAGRATAGAMDGEHVHEKSRQMPVVQECGGLRAQDPEMLVPEVAIHFTTGICHPINIGGGGGGASRPGRDHPRWPKDIIEWWT